MLNLSREYSQSKFLIESRQHHHGGFRLLGVILRKLLPLLPGKVNSSPKAAQLI
jgi:hypothetical protein